MRSLLVLALCVGCGNAKQPGFDGPMPVTFGACAAPTVAFVSGPRPLPFTPEQADGKWVIARPHDSTATREPDPSGFGKVGAGVRGDAAVPTTLNVLSAGVPTISIAPSTSSSRFDKDTLRRYIRRNLAKITRCYENQLQSTPDLGGTLNTHFVIGPDGGVTDITTDGFDPVVARCVADVISTIQFPPGGAPIIANYPFKFITAGGDARSPSSPPPSLEPVPRARAHELFRPTSAELPDSRTYDPSAGNPLRTHAEELAGCFRIGPKHYGAIVVELGHGTAVTYGLDDARTIDCVVAVAKRVEHADAQRCALGFGVMPMVDLPAIDITADRIAVNGKPIVETPQTVVADTTTLAAIASLTAVIASGVDEATKASAPIVAIHGPIVVRPEDATPMKVVERVLGSVLAGGDDFVLAARRGAGFELLMAIKLPVVPVPFGTGGRWNLVKSHTSTGPDRVTLSVLVTKQQIWVGAFEGQVLAFQPKSLLGALSEHKERPMFDGRVDIEIAAEGDVTYKALVDVIDTAAKAGFTDWRLTDPMGLAVRPPL